MADLTGDAGSLPAAEDEAGPALRIDIRAAMGIEAGPWVVVPGAAEGPQVRWVDNVRAVVAAPDAAAGDGLIAILGRSEVRSPAGWQRHEVVVAGWRMLLDVQPERMARLRERARRDVGTTAQSGPLEVRAIIPGRVVAVSVAEGDTIEAGHQLLVVEAMKMQNELRSPRAGVVERIAVGVGQTVDLGAVLVVLR